MPSKDKQGKPLSSKIASIQEFSNFPEAEHNLGPKDIDLKPRSAYAKHTLVGLNYFLVKMAEQSPDVLGIRTQDPMLVGKGVPPLQETETQILAQAATATADIAVSKIGVGNGMLEATVSLTNKAGHKFPSGVGFRRAFVEFQVLDAQGKVLWASGRTDPTGVLIDQNGAPVAGELWWTANCKRVVTPGPRAHQPHYQTITRQDQVQIYQELVSTPPAGGTSQCGHDVAPAGELTTSFLSICTEVKDNRLLPHGYLPVAARADIAKALGAGPDLAEDAGASVDDPDYQMGGGDSLVYRVSLAELKEAKPAAVQAALYYQATPPFYLQDRFCTAQGPDPERLYYLAGTLNLGDKPNLADTPASGWKLRVARTEMAKVP